MRDIGNTLDLEKNNVKTGHPQDRTRKTFFRANFLPKCVLQSFELRSRRAGSNRQIKII